MDYRHDVTLPAGQHFIGGEFRPASTGQTFEIVDPTTERVIGTAARGDATDAEQAVRAAQAAYDDGEWSHAKPSFRREVLCRAADLIEKRSDEINRYQALEMGEPVGPATEGPGFYVKRSAQNFRFFAHEQEYLGDEAFNLEDRLLTYTLTDPVGVYALITPWNGPFMLSTWKMAPCLAYGNTAVHKPSELAPLSLGILCEIFEEAGLPKGVYNLLHGIGSEVGPALVEHPDVVGVSFTGSRPTAQDIAARTASGLKRTSFELGGKSATIVFADADLARAVPEAAAAIYSTTGQSCVAGSRILVQRPVYEEFVERFKAESNANWTVGDPFDPETVLGPVVSKTQYDRVMSYIEMARSEGRLLVGGGRPAHLDKGYFIEPTAFDGIDPSSRVCQEEIFGPVAVVMPFDSDDEALEIANGTEFGLAGYIWTASQDRAHYISHRLHAGMIWINAGFVRDLRQPFGGVKMSGEGREGGSYSREFYTEKRFTSFPLTPR